MKYEQFKGKWYLAGLLVCSLLFFISFYQVICHYAEAKQAEEEFSLLAESVVQAGEKEPEQKREENGEESISILRKYEELFRENNDMAGWIQVEGTQINYPVMYTPDNPDYYLKHSFSKKSSSYGVPYIAEHCNPMEPSDNVIIYGHHMNNGLMFTGLLKYEDKRFYQQHKIIYFDTLTETGKYEVLAVFKTTVYNNTGFPYYLFSNAKTEEDFTDYVKQCKALSLYDTETTVKYGDKLLTLSTCEYSNTNGRFVVVARKL